MKRFLLILMMIFILPLSAKADMETKYTLIKGSDADIEAFRKALDPWYPFQSIDSPAMMVDGIFEQTQKLLGMKKEMEKIKINLYSNDEKLYVAYLELKDTAFRGFDNARRFRAWYIHSKRTIYINTKDVDSGMLGHEMAHAIVDHYLLVRPPEKTAEILAKYVDSHL